MLNSQGVEDDTKSTRRTYEKKRRQEEQADPDMFWQDVDELREWKEVKGKKRRKSEKGKPQEAESLMPFVTIEPEGFNAVQGNSEWEEINMAVDSGATETVVNEDMLEAVETKAGPASKRGVEYEVANGVRIPNKGEKKFVAVSESGTARKITAQVCDVNQALLSVAKVMKARTRVVFDEEG